MNSLVNSSVLVTGASGFIGSHLAERLLACGARVQALVRQPEKAGFLAKSGVEIVPGDVTDPQAVRTALEGCDWVFHFAGITAVHLPVAVHQAVHVRGTEIVARAALQARVGRFVYASSIAVYGLRYGKNIDEESPYHYSREAYSDTKLQAEKVVRQLIEREGLPALILQPGITYGPRDETWTLGQLRRIKAGRMVLPGGGRALMHPVFIGDLVKGILLAAERGKSGEAYILCGPQVVTFHQFFSRLAVLAGVQHIRSVPDWLATLAAAASESFARITKLPPALTRSDVRWVTTSRTYSTEKAHRELGFQPQIDLEAGMKQVESWLSATGILNEPPASQN